MVDLASLVVRLVADTNRFRGDLNRASQELSTFARLAKSNVGKVAIAAAAGAAAAATAFAAMAKSAIDAADDMNALSKSTGISTEDLSQLQYAAEQSATDLDTLTAGLRNFGKTATEAASKSGDARDAFRLIGVSVTDAAGELKTTDQLLLDVAEEFAKYQDGAAKAAFAQQLFGKSGAELIPFLNQGRAGIEQLKVEADRLGLTLGGSTAQAADDFNSQLKMLQKSLSGATLQIVGPMLPAFAELVKGFAELATEGERVNTLLSGLAIVFRTAAAGAVNLYYFVSNVGRQIGALAAIVVQAARGNFGEAAVIYEQNLADQLAAEKAQNKALALIYGERADIVTSLQEVQVTYKKKQPAFPQARELADQLQEVEINLKKINPPEDFYSDLQSKTQTSLERAFVDFQEKKAALRVLQIDAQIDTETFNSRLKEIETEMLDVLTRGPKQAKEEMKELNEFQIQAARNTQDIIADTFEGLATGADISAKSILQSFGTMIVKLAAQAAAANIAGKLFGEAGGGAKGSTGLLSAALSLFGGSRDSGGRGRAGVAYAIGTGAQPEMFIPDRSGTFVPAGAGGLQVTNNFTIQASEPLSRRTEMQIAAAASRGIARANRRNN